MTTWMGARQGGTTRPSSSECAMISAPTRRVETPQEVVQAYSCWFSGVWYMMSKARAKFWPRLWEVPAWRGRPDRERLRQLLPSPARDDGDLGGEPLDVLRLLLQEAHRNEEREVGVDVAGRLDAAVQLLLDVLPDGVAVRLDHHAAAHRRVVRQVRLGDEIEIPLRVVLRARGDAGLWHDGRLSPGGISFQLSAFSYQSAKSC